MADLIFAIRDIPVLAWTTDVHRHKHMVTEAIRDAEKCLDQTPKVKWNVFACDEVVALAETCEWHLHAVSGRKRIVRRHCFWRLFAAWINRKQPERFWDDAAPLP